MNNGFLQNQDICVWQQIVIVTWQHNPLFRNESHRRMDIYTTVGMYTHQFQKLKTNQVYVALTYREYAFLQFLNHTLAN